MGTQPTIVVASLLGRSGGTGVQSHVHSLLDAAPAAGETIRWVTPFDFPTPLVYAAFGPGRLARPLSKGAWVWWHREGHAWMLRRALFRELDRRGSAIVYAQDPLSALAALDARDAGFPIEVTLVVHFNESQADEWAEMGCIRPGGRLYRSIAAAEERALPRVDRLIFPSRFMASVVARRHPRVAEVEQSVVPNCAAAPPPASRDDLSGDLVSIGSLEPRKGQEALLRALRACHAAGRRYRLTLIGDGPLRGRLQRLAGDLGLGSHVRFAGYVPEARRHIAAHRAYVHAAKLENLPVAVIEALAAGRPVLAPPVGGIPEIFTDRVEGRYWDPGDHAAAARAWMEVLDNEPVYSAMCAAAHARHRETFDPAVVVPELIRAIRGGRGGDARTPRSRERSTSAVAVTS